MFEPNRRFPASTWLRLAGLGIVAVLSVISAPAGAQPPLSDRALSSSDVPAGYSKFVRSVSSTQLPCQELYLPAHIGPRILIGFDANGSAFQEGLVQLQESKSAQSLFAYLDHHYSTCHHVDPVSGFKVSGTGRRISFPMVGEQSQAFSFTLTFKHTPVDTEMVLFRQGTICGEVNYIGGVAVTSGEMDAVAARAADKTLINSTA